MKVGKNDIDLIEVGKLVLLGTGVYLIYKHILKETTTESTSKKIVEQQKKEIPKFRKLFQQTYPNEYYYSLANSIFNSIAYSGVSDDYTATFQLMLKPKNPLDMALLIQAYDVRQRETLGIPTGYPEDLITSVSNELRSEVIYNPFSKRKYELLNDYYASKNINWRV